MWKLSIGMNVSLDGHIAAPGDDLGWGVPSDELFQWWSDRVGATGRALYGAQAVGDDELPLADRRPAAWRHTGADRVRSRRAPDQVRDEALNAWPPIRRLTSHAWAEAHVLLLPLRGHAHAASGRRRMPM